jgi:hypothetical protein
MKRGSGSQRRYTRASHLTWCFQHKGKRVYPSKARAWRACWRIWLRQLHTDDLRPYECTWRNEYARGRTSAPHIHIGHDRHRRTLGKRVRYWRLRLTVWPYYRLRTRWRNPGHFRDRGVRARRTALPPGR